MILDREVTVYVCAPSVFALAYWTNRFEQFFDATTTVQAFGTWEGESEPVNLVSHLYNECKPDFAHYALGQLVREYKREAKQETALVVWREVKAKLV